MKLFSPLKILTYGCFRDQLLNTELVPFGLGRAGVIDTSAPDNLKVGRLDLP